MRCCSVRGGKCATNGLGLAGVLEVGEMVVLGKDSRGKEGCWRGGEEICVFAMD